MTKIKPVTNEAGGVCSIAQNYQTQKAENGGAMCDKSCGAMCGIKNHTMRDFNAKFVEQNQNVLKNTDENMSENSLKNTPEKFIKPSKKEFLLELKIMREQKRANKQSLKKSRAQKTKGERVLTKKTQKTQKNNEKLNVFKRAKSAFSDLIKVIKENKAKNISFEEWQKQQEQLAQKLREKEESLKNVECQEELAVKPVCECEACKKLTQISEAEVCNDVNEVLEHSINNNCIAGDVASEACAELKEAKTQSQNCLELTENESASNDYTDCSLAEDCADVEDTKLIVQDFLGEDLEPKNLKTTLSSRVRVNEWDEKEYKCRLIYTNLHKNSIKNWTLDEWIKFFLKSNALVDMSISYFSNLIKKYAVRSYYYSNHVAFGSTEKLFEEIMDLIERKRQYVMLKDFGKMLLKRLTAIEVKIVDYFINDAENIEEILDVISKRSVYRYGDKIMTKLANLMQSRGYTPEWCYQNFRHIARR